MQSICEHVEDNILAKMATKLDIQKQSFETKQYIAL